MNTESKPLSPEVVRLLESLRFALSKPKHFFTRAEIETIYRIYNLQYGTNKPVTSCGSCVTNTTNAVRKLFTQYNNSHG